MIILKFSFLNYDKSQQEYDVWANHILARESDETNGIFTGDNQIEFTEERLPVVLNDLVVKNTPVDVVETTKWKGKPSDRTIIDDLNGREKPIHHFS